MNILIVKMSAIGDVIHTLPALTALRRHFPAAKITWLVEETAADLLQDHPDLDNILVWSRRHWTGLVKSGRWGAAIRELSSFIRTLRDTRYDLLLDFQALLKSAVWIQLTRADRKVGFGPGMAHSEGSYCFLDEHLPAISMEVHALDRGLIMLQHLGIPVDRVDYGLRTAPEEESEVQQLLAETNQFAPLVVFNPMSRWPTKQWDNLSFGQLAERLAREGVNVAFTGSPQDKTAIDECCDAMSQPAIRCDGKTRLSTLAELYRRADVLVTTDTGPMHLAAAVATPVVALFGPTAPWRTGPYGDQHTVLRSKVNCSPCFRRRCLTTEYEPLACMRRITVEQVFQSVMNKITGASPIHRASGQENA